LQGSTQIKPLPDSNSGVDLIDGDHCYP
jgi:hypothetical protein